MELPLRYMPSNNLPNCFPDCRTDPFNYCMLVMGIPLRFLIMKTSWATFNTIIPKSEYVFSRAALQLRSWHFLGTGKPLWSLLVHMEEVIYHASFIPAMQITLWGFLNFPCSLPISRTRYSDWSSNYSSSFQPLRHIHEYWSLSIQKKELKSPDRGRGLLWGAHALT